MEFVKVYGYGKSEGHMMTNFCSFPSNEGSADFIALWQWPLR